MSDVRGDKVGVVDEYGSVWDGEPGAQESKIIGDLVVRPDEETSDLHLLLASVSADVARMKGVRVPDYAENPNYGVYPCAAEWHRQRQELDTKCPSCKNGWWALDGSDCPEEDALLVEIDELRRELARQQHIWTMQSRVIRALQAHVPDAVRAVALSEFRTGMLGSG